ncbi:hypothetical protein LUZ63_016890 [Rhynchospora breviuscula]|uniref:AAA+ ATPase domain-containing protein n=1 Tax=Rhynchospora breviuscula TaxID=2022672 RepID=A0A9Q0C0R8_9POAL|nr:hypothetical protein LUZ63_016890 [Rhynchospora breviuscula]
MEFLSSTVPSVIPLVANTIFKHVAYPFTAGDNTKALELAIRDLQALKEDVNATIKNAEQENGAPTNQAKEWLLQVETIEREAEVIQQKYQQLCRCIWNISPNFCAIYKVSRRATKINIVVKSLCEKIKTIDVVTHLPPPVEMPASSSKTTNLESALHSIKDDVHNNIIGIWGMGGVGKTHLLEQINNAVSQDLAFEVIVVFVTCSKECSEEKVQNKIIEKLGLSMSDSIEQKQSMIYNFFRKRSFVLLLDDLWSRVDLKIVGIPNPMEAVGTYKRKVVLTTRSTEVCGQMEVREKIRVDVLNWDDAWCLFNEKVTEETIDSDPLIEKCAIDVVKELGGLPLALITIGRAMYDKTDHREWEHAVKLLKLARLNDLEFSGSNQSVFHTLKFSYDNLKNDDNNLRQCFLHCSLWPEDYCISKDELIHLWIGLGLIDEPKIQEAYDTGHRYIGRLQAVCLLEVGDTYGNTVKMHDVIRDMALWISNDQGKNINKWIVQAGIYETQQQQPQNFEIEVSGYTEKLSIMRNYGCTLSISITCVSATLSTLLLNNNSIEDPKILQLELFSKLTFLDLSSNSLEAFPVEICKLVHLQFLNLSENSFLKTLLPEELGALANLKILLLFHTNLTFPNKVLPKLKALRVLDLRQFSMAENFHNFSVLQEELQCLPNFEALGFSIPNSSTIDFHEFSQKVRVPIKWLGVSRCTESCLIFLSCFLQNSYLQNNLLSIEIRRMIDVEYVKFERTGENQNDCHLGRLETLHFYRMDNMKEVLWKGPEPKDVFPRLQSLMFLNCYQLTSISWIVNLPCIRTLELHSCTSIKQLIRTDELKISGVEVSQLSFPSLKTIVLEENSGLERISDSIITFPAMEFLYVFKCGNLKVLPFKPSNPPRRLKLIQGFEEWWNTIEMEDGDDKSVFQPFFKKWDF